MAFHLDVGAGTALAAAPDVSASPRTSAPAIAPEPPALAATTPAFPPAAPPDAGNHGWGVREQRPSLYPSWTPSSEMSEPAANAPRIGRSRAALRALVLLIFVALVGAGAFLYLRSESTQGFGSGVHTVSAPAMLGGLTESTSSAMTALSSQVQSQIAASPGIAGSVFTVYGFATAGGPGYILDMVSDDHAVTSADLSHFVSGFNSTSGAALNLTTATVSSDNGVSFHCAPVTVASAATTMCVWGDGNVLGVVIGSSGAGSTAALAAAEEARGTAEH